jgi:hypothetical protein
MSFFLPASGETKLFDKNEKKKKKKKKRKRKKKGVAKPPHGGWLATP